MKKIFLILVLCCMLLVGCSKKSKIICHSEQIIQNNAYQTKYILEYQKDNLKKLEYDINVIIEQSNMPNYDSYYGAFIETFKKLGNEAGTLVSINKSSDGYQANIKIDYDEFNGNSSLMDNKLKRNDALNYLVNSGYKCE